MFQRHLFRKAAILGTGLIGGSIGLALKKQGLAGRVAGSSRQEASIRTAISMGAIDEGDRDIHKVIQGADLVVLAAPVNVILDNIREIARNLRRGCVVTDTGSTKTAVVEAAEKFFPPHVLFVGSHPMAGSEKSGVAHASADLFAGASCILTPTDKTNRLARDKVKQLWTKFGMDVSVMTPARHDEVMAYVSHLPHLAAFALMRAVPKDMAAYGASGLRDTTRLAGSSPAMWNDICVSNYRNILRAVDDMTRSLAELRKAVVEKNEKALAACMDEARARRELLDKPAAPRGR